MLLEYLQENNNEALNYTGQKGDRQTGSTVYKQLIDILLAGRENGAFIHFDKLGLYGLLYGMCDNRSLTSQMSSFSGHKLGVLVDYERTHRTELYDSLVNYLVNNCNLALTAEKLFIHPNTLRYRLKRIEKLLKIDLSRVECVVEITLAVKINQVKKWLSPNQGGISACSYQG